MDATLATTYEPPCVDLDNREVQRDAAILFAVCLPVIIAWMYYVRCQVLGGTPVIWQNGLNACVQCFKPAFITP
jgi:hypothetical protein